jgi:hypothetical protein
MFEYYYEREEKNEKNEKDENLKQNVGQFIQGDNENLLLLSNKISALFPSDAEGNDKLKIFCEILELDFITRYIHFFPSLSNLTGKMQLKDWLKKLS